MGRVQGRHRTDGEGRHGGSAHRVFVDLEASDEEPCDESNFYRKLARTPDAISRALLREGSQRLRLVLPSSAEPVVRLPECFTRYTLFAGDGKKIKDAASAVIWEQTRRRPMVLPLVVEA